MSESEHARFERWMREFGPALSRTASSYEWQPARRDELVQDIGLAIWRALPQFRGDSSERSFVLRIAHNRCISHVSREQREPKSDALDDEVIGHQPGPDACASERQQFERLQRALLQLPMLDRELVSLSLEGIGYQEIADICGLSSNHVGVRLHRAKQALKRLLSDVESKK